MSRRQTYSHLAAHIQSHTGRGGGGNTIINISGEGGGGGAYLPLNGSGEMAGNLDMGGNNIVDVGLINGLTLGELAGHDRLHDILSVEDHSVTGSEFQVVGLIADNTLGLMDSTTNAVSSPSALLRAPAVAGDPITLPPTIWKDGSGTQLATITDDGVFIRGTETVSPFQGIDVYGNSRIVGDLEITGSINVDIVVGDFIYTGDGSFRTPSLSFQDDDDLGIFRSDENEMTFVADAEYIADFSNVAIHTWVPTYIVDLFASNAEVSQSLTMTGIGDPQIVFEEHDIALAIRSVLGTNALTLLSDDFMINEGSLRIGNTSEGVVIDASRQFYANSNYTFANDTDTGFFRTGTNNIAIRTGGDDRITLNALGVTMDSPLIASTFRMMEMGSVTEPALFFNGDSDTGLYWLGSGNVAITTNGVKQLDIDALGVEVTGDLLVSGAFNVDSIVADTVQATESVLTPTLLFTDDDSIKIYSSAADQLRFTLTGDNILLTDTQNVLYKATTIVDLSANEAVLSSATINAASFEPPIAGPPFYLSTEAQGQTVTGLRADQLNKSVTAGDGLDGGGTLTDNISLAVDDTVARRNAINNFTAYQQITAVTPAIYLTNTTPVTWGMVNLNTALAFYLDGVSKFNITSSGDITISGGLTVDGDTLYVDKTTDAVWINSGTPNGSATFKVTSGFADDITAVFKAASSQSAYIWEVQDSAGDGLIGIDASGNLQSLSPVFVSGRSGWRATTNGDFQINNLVARGEIRTAVFVKDEIAVDSGSHLFAEGALTLTAFTAGAGTLTLNIKDPPYEHARIFNVGDNLIMRSGGIRDYSGGTGPHIIEPWDFFHPRPPDGGNVLVATQVWLTVTGFSDEGTYYSYEVIKQSGPAVTFPENTTVVSYGQGSTGLIGIFADQNYGPYLDVFLPGATPWNTTPVTPVRLGRLDGIGLPELAAEQYGIAISTDLSDSGAGRIIASNTQFLINNVDFTVTDGETTVFEIDAAEPSFYIGTDASLPLESDQISFNKANETGGILIGNPNNSYLSVDNATIGGQNSLRMFGRIEVIKAQPSDQPEFGEIAIDVPITFGHFGSGTIHGGYFAGDGTFDEPTTGIKLWRDTATSAAMAGYVDSAESWSVNASGDWSFADGEVQINGGGIQITASSIFDDEETQNQLRWLATDGSIVGAINGFEAETLSGSSGVAVNGFASATNSLVSLNAETPESAGSISISALLSGSSSIQLNATEVYAANAMRVGDRLILMPISNVAIHATGATIYLDASSGDLKVLFANAVTKTLATN